MQSLCGRKGGRGGGGGGGGGWGVIVFVQESSSHDSLLKNHQHLAIPVNAACFDLRATNQCTSCNAIQRSVMEVASTRRLFPAFHTAFKVAARDRLERLEKGRF